MVACRDKTRQDKTTTAFRPGCKLILFSTCAQLRKAWVTSLQLNCNSLFLNIDQTRPPAPRTSTLDCPDSRARRVSTDPPTLPIQILVFDIALQATSKSRTSLRGRLGTLGGTCPTEWIFPGPWTQFPGSTPTELSCLYTVSIPS